MSMRGSVTVLMKNRGYGRIVGEDGCELYFDETSLDAVDLRALSVRDCVEYQEEYWGVRVRAVKVRPIAGANDRRGPFQMNNSRGSSPWNGRKRRAVMSVRQLMARLAIAAPDDIVVIDTNLQCLLLLHERTGKFLPLYVGEGCSAQLTERDKEFLRALRVQF